jgi:hypothetical protein
LWFRHVAHSVEVLADSATMHIGGVVDYVDFQEVTQNRVDEASYGGYVGVPACPKIFRFLGM